MLLGMTPVSVEAQAQLQDCLWTDVEKPGPNGNVVVHPSDVSDIAIGQSVFYAVDEGQATIYRSLSGGLRWEDISGYLGAAGATLPVEKIAVAPDESAIVAVATDGGSALYLSVDGGVTWGNVHLGVVTGTTVQSIDISKPYGEYNEQRDILVGTADFSDAATTGQVLLLHLGSFVPSWKNLDIRVNPTTIGGDVSAVAFSPSYTDDLTIVAIASTGSDINPPNGKTYLCVGLNVDVVAGNVDWTSIAPLEIPPGLSVGDDLTVTHINGGLELPSNFSATGASGKSPLVYAFYTLYPAPGADPSNVYQIDLVTTTVTAFTGVGSRRYSSIALSGNKLLAGEMMPSGQFTVPVQISLNANSTAPAFTQTGYPYGQTDARVAWNSNVAYCGTSGDESGFSISNDNGAHWSQVGLIDTTVVLRDVAVAYSPKSIFITSTSITNVESVWRSAGEPFGASWGRMLVTDAVSSNLIVRISPYYRKDYTLYVTEAKTDLPVITSFTADPSTVFTGNPSNLQWNVTGATSVSISPGFPSVPASGTQAVSPAATTTYTLTATNGFGSVTASVTVTVVTIPGLPQIASFTANPGSIDIGQSSTLQWNVTGATSVSIDQDIGAVTLTGAITVYPVTTTTYTLTATNAVGSITAFTTVTVTPQTWVSHDRGNAWEQCYPPPGIIDFAVADKEVCYVALPDGNVAKSTTSGLFWDHAVSVELPEIAMLSLVDADTVFIGGNHGDVSYSSDGGSNYTQIPVAIPSDGPVQVVADTDYENNHILYAGSANSIYRWTIDVSSNWDTIRTTAAGRKISGIVAVDGILYSLWYTAAGSGAERSLQPQLSLALLEWDTLLAGAETARFDCIPTSLRYIATDREVILWTIDTTGDSDLMVYYDCLAWHGPDLTMSNDTVIGCDPATGRNQEVNFTWDAICADNRYQLQVAKDSGFAKMVFDSGDDYPFLLPSDILSPALVYSQGGGGTFPILQGVIVPALECGHTYYWRVRARAAVTSDIIRSPWSEVHAFTVKAGYQVATPYYGPQLLAPDNGCGCDCKTPACFSWTPLKETTAYRFELSANADMSTPLVSTTVKNTAYQYDGQLECNKNYFWRVMAIQPAPSEWSATFSFQVWAEQQPSPQPVVPEARTPLWVWMIMASGAILIVTIIILIVKNISNREEGVEENET